ncbi:MAG: hypothetical protein J6D23_06965, partial [Clostridia bacterium]|nr:hypothetical protein [Clostridia bacterium]
PLAYYGLTDCFANFERTNKGLDKLKICRRLKNRQEFLMQYKTLFVVPNRVQLGLVVATRFVCECCKKRARVKGKNPSVLALLVLEFFAVLDSA